MKNTIPIHKQHEIYNNNMFENKMREFIDPPLSVFSKGDEREEEIKTVRSNIIRDIALAYLYCIVCDENVKKYAKLTESLTKLGYLL